jgi:teichuronic acid biosynthesis glycosyltransferase TuaC
MKILVLASLYPNGRMPNHGIFVENRLRRLAEAGVAVTEVIASVPWFFSTHERFGEYAKWAAVPAREMRHGIGVSHPRYLMIPKLGFWLQPWLMYRAIRQHLRQVPHAIDNIDLIDAQFYYPDGVAAHWLSRDLGVPFVVTARGTDINLVPRSPLPCRLIRSTGKSAAASITVCTALKDSLAALGVPEPSITVVRNGVDLARFTTGNRAAARACLGLDGTVLLSVGHLIERKGHHLVIKALARLPAATLVIVGGGPERAALEALSVRTGTAERVRFAGELAHAELPLHYRAADALVLASSREGCANVLLEAMACGTPVVATPVWGTPEIVAEPVAGRLSDDRSVDALVRAIGDLLADPPARSATRRYAERFSWQTAVDLQLGVYRKAAGARHQEEVQPYRSRPWAAT